MGPGLRCLAGELASGPERDSDRKFSCWNWDNTRHWGPILTAVISRSVGTGWKDGPRISSHSCCLLIFLEHDLFPFLIPAASISRSASSCLSATSECFGVLIQGPLLCSWPAPFAGASEHPLSRGSFHSPPAT